MDYKYRPSPEAQRVNEETCRAIDSLERPNERAAAIRTLVSIFGNRSKFGLVFEGNMQKALSHTHGAEHRQLTTALESLIRPHADAQGVITMCGGTRVRIADTLSSSRASPIRQDTIDGRPYGDYVLMAQEEGKGPQARMQSIRSFIGSLHAERN